MTRTYATLEVPATVYAAIKALLERADGRELDAGEPIDMNGIALVKQSKGSNARTAGVMEISSMLSSKDWKGRLEFQIGGEVIQLDVRKAREVVQMFNEAIEAAITDEMMFTFLTTRMQLDEGRAAAVVFDMREVRQGARDVVNPS